jgi:putative phosphoesterase
MGFLLNIDLMQLGIISDAHANLKKTERVLKELESWNTDKIINLGDILDFGNEPNQVIELLIKQGIICTAGNHDKLAFDRSLQKIHPKFINDINKKTKSKLTPKSLKFIKSLPLYVEDRINRLHFVHGIPPNDIFSYLYNQTDENLVQLFENARFDICFVGHTHIACIVEYNTISGHIKKFHNPDLFIMNRGCRYIISVGAVNSYREGLIDDDFTDIDERPQFVVLMEDTIYFKKVKD